VQSQAGVITITTRATARPRPTTRPRRAVAAGAVRVASPATYWRRRVAVVLVAVALVLVMARAGVALGGSTPAAPERHPAPSAQVSGSTGASTLVRPGDSLWSVAERLVPGEDPRPVVDSLAEARHGTVLTPGETITWNG
jgi:Tfp pilus assembly protein FimV